MDKKKLVLACLAAAEGHTLEPVQIQKLIFLFQEKSGKYSSKKPFSFVPYDYGPFSSDIYSVLESLSMEGSVEIVGGPFERNRYYSLKPEGIQKANSFLSTFDPVHREFLNKLTAWIRKCSFAQLVGAVYKEYPKMRVRSIFRD